MDKKDIKILIELDKNPRENNSIIGKKVGLSKQAVSSRIQNLLNTHIIITPILFVNMNALGITPTKVFFSFQNVTPAKKQEIVNYLKNEKIVGGLMTFEGPYDLFAGIMAQNQIDLDDFLSKFYNKYTNNIKEKKIVTLADSSVYPRGYLQENKIKPLNKPKYFFAHPTIIQKLKKADYAILGTLVENPLYSYTELSKILKIPVQTIINRIKTLEKIGVINGFGIYLNEKIFISYILLVELSVMTDEIRQEIMNFVKGHPNFVMTVRTVGEWNYEFAIEGMNLQECLTAIEDFKKKFAQSIRSCIPLLVNKMEKMQNYKA